MLHLSDTFILSQTVGGKGGRERTKEGQKQEGTGVTKEGEVLWEEGNCGEVEAALPFASEKLARKWSLGACL